MLSLLPYLEGLCFDESSAAYRWKNLQFSKCSVVQSDCYGGQRAVIRSDGESAVTQGSGRLDACGELIGGKLGGYLLGLSSSRCAW
jgi:hypothetical protein